MFICLLFSVSILTERLLTPSKARVYNVENFAAVIVDNPIKIILHEGDKLRFDI